MPLILKSPISFLFVFFFNEPSLKFCHTLLFDLNLTEEMMAMILLYFQQGNDFNTSIICSKYTTLRFWLNFGLCDWFHFQDQFLYAFSVTKKKLLRFICLTKVSFNFKAVILTISLLLSMFEKHYFLPALWTVILNIF